MRKLELIIPGFLRQFDRYLLENNPIVWASKLHYVAFFSTLVTIPLILRAFIWSPSLDMIPDLELSLGLMMVPTAILGIIWLISQIRFNSHKEFGTNTSLTLAGKMGLSLTVLIAIVAPLIIYGNVMSWKVAHSLSDQEFSSDINALNIGATYYMYEQDQIYDHPYLYGNYTPWQWEGSQAVLSGSELREIFSKVTLSKAEMIQEVRTFQHALLKYGGKPKLSPEEVVENFTLGMRETNYYNGFRPKEIHRNLDRIAISKTHKLFSISDFEFFGGLLLTMLYSVFILLIYKSVDWKYFLTGLISSMLIPPAVAMLGLGSRELLQPFMYMKEQNAIFLYILGGGIFLLIQSLRVFYKEKSDWLTGTSLVSLSFMTPFAPFLVMAYIDSNSGIWITEMDVWVSLYVGVAFFIGIFLVAYRKAFQRLYALPK